MANIICQRCQANNRPGARFCAACGQTLLPLTSGPKRRWPEFNLNHLLSRFKSSPQKDPSLGQICPACRSVNRPAARHCAYCGCSLSANQPGFKSLPFGSRLQSIFQGIRQRREIAGALAGALLLVFLLVITISGLSKDQAIISQAMPTATDTPVGSLIQTVQALPSLAPSEGTIATLVVVAAPGGTVDIPELSDEEEIEIGRQSAANLESQMPVSQNAALINRVRKIGDSILPYQPRQNIPFTFKVLDTDDINAYALPGGFIYVTKGMLDFVQSDDELAGVIGHEIAHVSLYHGAQQIRLYAAAELAMERISTQDPDSESVYYNEAAEIGVSVASTVLLHGWGHDAEFEADEHGTIYMARAGYRPQAIIDLFQRIDSMTYQITTPLDQLLSTHPPFPERIARVEETIEDNNL
jgi:beta-barrel assembly-enhancing protease